MSLKLAEVPQIPRMLKDALGRELSQEQQEAIEEYAIEHSLFAGEAAVQLGIISPSTLQLSLLDQSALKATAAMQDIEVIAKTGKQTKPAFLKANWGNNNVNKATETPSLYEGAAAAANIAQNMVMIANDHPELAIELRSAVDAAAKLGKDLSHPQQAYQLSNDAVTALLEKAIEGLRIAVRKSGDTPTDAKGSTIDLNIYLQERGNEIQQSHTRLINAMMLFESVPVKSHAMGAQFSQRQIGVDA